MNGDDVLILTARFDDDAFAHFDGLRRRHFPPKLNKIPAHVTLFHHLPAAHTETLFADLAALAGVQPAIAASARFLRFLGKGTAVEIDAPPLISFRNQLARRWDAWLVPQDRQKFKPHVTIQNKVEPALARRTFEDLSHRWERFDFTFVGVTLWNYLGGPWERVNDFHFVE